MCGKSGVGNSLGDDGKLDDIDGEDLEAYNGFTGESTLIDSDRTAAV